MRACFRTWKLLLRKDGLCVLVVGDARSRMYMKSLPDALSTVAEDEVGGFVVRRRYTETIPAQRRVRRSYRGSEKETIIALQKVC
jgi:hypothetical protein